MRRPLLFLMDYRRWEGERQAVCSLEIEDLRGWEGWDGQFEDGRKLAWSALGRRSPVVLENAARYLSWAYGREEAGGTSWWRPARERDGSDEGEVPDSAKRARHKCGF
jgi:hypothetical protein